MPIPAILVVISILTTFVALVVISMIGGERKDVPLSISSLVYSATIVITFLIRSPSDPIICAWVAAGTIVIVGILVIVFGAVVSEN